MPWNPQAFGVENYRKGLKFHHLKLWRWWKKLIFPQWRQIELFPLPSKIVDMERWMFYPGLIDSRTNHETSPCLAVVVFVCFCFDILKPLKKKKVKSKEKTPAQAQARKFRKKKMIIKIFVGPFCKPPAYTKIAHHKRCDDRNLLGGWAPQTCTVSS